MNITEYQEKSKRTLNTNLTNNELLSNMAMGISGETGEVIDHLKKYLYQGHDLQIDLIGEEIGDVMFYIANLCNLLEIDLKDVIEGNYNKLLKRYPDGFSKEKSINRGE